VDVFPGHSLGKYSDVDEGLEFQACYKFILFIFMPMEKLDTYGKLPQVSNFCCQLPWATQCFPYANISSSGNATMKMSQQCIAEECDQRYISVTYDLTIAKIALCVPSEEKLEFNNLFILLGFFHIAL
jgi:hypothetical protein